MLEHSQPQLREVKTNFQFYFDDLSSTGNGQNRLDDFFSLLDMSLVHFSEIRLPSLVFSMKLSLTIF